MPVNLSVQIPLECMGKWSWAFHLGFCIRDGYDIADFVFGFTSLIVWSVALIPQIVQNYNTKTVESQSIGFWILWCIGDATNLMGCFLTNQIVTNTLLAIMYSVCSVLALLQWIYYTYFYKKRNSSLKGSARTVAKRTGVLGGVFCWLCFVYTNSPCTDILLLGGRRRLLHLSPIEIEVLGRALGWIMAFVYVFSRVPQIYKSLNTKDLADLSLKMFMGTFIGNLTQMLSMVIMHVKYLN